MFFLIDTKQLQYAKLNAVFGVGIVFIRKQFDSSIAENVFYVAHWETYVLFYSELSF